MVKVCHITSVHKRYDGRIFDRECVSLAEEGYQTYLVVNDDLDDEVCRGVNIHSTGFVTSSRIKRMTIGSKRVIKNALKIDADIYHLHDPELLLFALKLKKRGKKVVFDSHEFYCEQIRTKIYIKPLLRNLVAEIYFKFETYVTKRIDGVIIPCKLDGANVFENRTPKVAFVDNVPRLIQVESKKDKPSASKKICYAGSLTYARGICHLVQAMKKIEGTLVLAGEFSPQNFEDDVMSVAQGANIDFRGKLSRDEVLAIYQECDLGACTLLDMGQYGRVQNMSTKVYEYMMAELPVLLSDFPHNRELITKYKFGVLVKPDDVDDIEKKIREIFDNPKQAEKMGKRGKALVETLMNWDVEKKKLFKFYQQILSDGI